jgi:hypothetical protein
MTSTEQSGLADIGQHASHPTLCVNDVISPALHKGLPLARAALCPGARLTNVDPLDAAALDRCYGDGPREADKAGVQRFMAAQAFGGPD